LPHTATCEIGHASGPDVIHRRGLVGPPSADPAAGGGTGVDGLMAVGPRWHALWTRSHCERLVRDQLAAKGFDVFLPTVDVWSRRTGIRHRIQVPMFPGYLFVRHIMDKESYIEVQKARGLVCVLGERWDALAVVPDREVEAIQRVARSRVPVLPHQHLREGQRARVTCGPLADVEGILVRQEPYRGVLVLSVELLRRSVAVEVDCTWVVPA